MFIGGLFCSGGFLVSFSDRFDFFLCLKRRHSVDYNLEAFDWFFICFANDNFLVGGDYYFGFSIFVDCHNHPVRSCYHWKSRHRPNLLSLIRTLLQIHPFTTKNDGRLLHRTRLLHWIHLLRGPLIFLRSQIILTLNCHRMDCRRCLRPRNLNNLKKSFGPHKIRIRLSPQSFTHAFSPPLSLHVHSNHFLFFTRLLVAQYPLPMVWFYELVSPNVYTLPNCSLYGGRQSWSLLPISQYRAFRLCFQ